MISPGLDVLAEQIAYIDEIVNKDFTKYDQDAIRDQRYHIFFAHTAVLTGTLAILIPLLQLTGFLPEELSLPGETIATVSLCYCCRFGDTLGLPETLARGAV